MRVTDINNQSLKVNSSQSIAVASGRIRIAPARPCQWKSCILAALPTIRVDWCLAGPGGPGYIASNVIADDMSVKKWWKVPAFIERYVEQYIKD